LATVSEWVLDSERARESGLVWVRVLERVSE
jgi:hypothetical protein